VLTGVVRSGLTEARHPVSVAVADGSGRILTSLGGHLDRPFFARSAAKPFQAAVAQEHGADLLPEQLAVVVASHGGQPVHVAYVGDLLAAVGLDHSALRCPPSWPLTDSAGRLAAARGADRPLAVFHNCSGKHAGMLRACVARGWSLDYTDPTHPLQRANARYWEEVTGGGALPVGVDGCGVPTFRTTVPGLAAAFARLASDPHLAGVRTAMARFGPLTSDGERREALLARWFPAAVKGGAQGCLGVAWYGGLGIAAKSWSGNPDAAMVGIIESLHRLSLLPDHPAAMLEPVARPVVTGGGEPVGALEPIGGGE
jgi:L-asparaginase II